ncbi:GATA zinc finger domain-containing protein 10-like [Ceratitis capitata]|uniref:GATA zinc finger domain-containing protein 10-like n=1 Tax=Ceratitis capitata TaxID=7213 RepID=UPI000329F075|nr:GATA zinc finger domain-containing protein 10-like [Ceratitis capitata]
MNYSLHHQHLPTRLLPPHLSQSPHQHQHQLSYDPRLQQQQQQQHHQHNHHMQQGLPQSAQPHPLSTANRMISRIF